MKYKKESESEQKILYSNETESSTERYSDIDSKKQEENYIKECQNELSEFLFKESNVLNFSKKKLKEIDSKDFENLKKKKHKFIEDLKVLLLQSEIVQKYFFEIISRKLILGIFPYTEIFNLLFVEFEKNNDLNSTFSISKHFFKELDILNEETILKILNSLISGDTAIIDTIDTYNTYNTYNINTNNIYNINTNNINNNNIYNNNTYNNNTYNNNNNINIANNNLTNGNINDLTKNSIISHFFKETILFLSFIFKYSPIDDLIKFLEKLINLNFFDYILTKKSKEIINLVEKIIERIYLKQSFNIFSDFNSEFLRKEVGKLQYNTAFEIKRKGGIMVSYKEKALTTPLNIFLMPPSKDPVPCASIDLIDILMKKFLDCNLYFFMNITIFEEVEDLKKNIKIEIEDQNNYKIEERKGYSSFVMQFYCKNYFREILEEIKNWNCNFQKKLESNFEDLNKIVLDSNKIELDSNKEAIETDSDFRILGSLESFNLIQSNDIKYNSLKNTPTIDTNDSLFNVSIPNTNINSTTCDIKLEATPVRIIVQCLFNRLSSNAPLKYFDYVHNIFLIWLINSIECTCNLDEPHINSETYKRKFKMYQRNLLGDFDHKTELTHELVNLLAVVAAYDDSIVEDYPFIMQEDFINKFYLILEKESVCLCDYIIFNTISDVALKINKIKCINCSILLLLDKTLNKETENTHFKVSHLFIITNISKKLIKNSKFIKNYEDGLLKYLKGDISGYVKLLTLNKRQKNKNFKFSENENEIRNEREFDFEEKSDNEVEYNSENLLMNNLADENKNDKEDFEELKKRLKKKKIIEDDD